MKQETITKRRKEIFDAALTVFSKKGFDKATLDEIADKVKISKPALYLYFKNKESLFFTMVEYKTSSMGEKLTEIMKTKQSSLDKLKTVISFNINFYINNLEFFKIMHNIKFSLDQKEKSKLHIQFIKKYGTYLSGFEKLVKQCIKDGYLKKQHSLFLTFTLMGMMNHSIFGSLIINKSSYLENIDKKIIELFLKGAGK